MTCNCENCKAHQRLLDMKHDIEWALSKEHKDMAEALEAVRYTIVLKTPDQTIADALTDRDDAVLDGLQKIAMRAWLANAQPEGSA